MSTDKEKAAPGGGLVAALARKIKSLTSYPPLGRVLVRHDVITRHQLEKALHIQRSDPQRLGEIIVEQGFASEIEILQAITRSYGVYADSLGDDIAGMVRSRPRSLLGRFSLQRLPIRARLSIAITVIVGATIITLSFVTLERQRRNLYDQAVKTGKASLAFFAGDAAVSLLEDDIVSLNTLIREASALEGLVFVSIADRSRTIKAHTDEKQIGGAYFSFPPDGEPEREDDLTYYRTWIAGGQHVLVLSRPVSFSDVVLGEAAVGLSLDFIDRQISQESLYVIALSFFIVLFGIGIAIKIGVGFSQPISKLVEATHEIGKGNFQHRITDIRKDEFGDLAAAFNYMSRELWKKLRMQKSFGSYVSPEILQMIMAHPEEEWLKGSRMKVSVLFADIRGFTSYSEGKTPEEVVDSVNRYFQIATRHIQHYGGYIDKFIGDAVLGVFGAPAAREDHALRAVRAAQAMQAEFQLHGRTENAFLSRVGIGLASGEAVAGDLGSETKKEYSVIGPCVNLASHLSSLAAPGQIVVSSSTLELCGPGISSRPLGTFRVKGLQKAVDTFELLDVCSGESPATAHGSVS